MKSLTLTCALLVIVGSFTSGCNEMTDEQMDELVEPRVTAFFNSTGTRQGNERDTHADEALVQAIDNARGQLDICMYGFSNRKVIAAVIRAWERGVNVRVAGDARHFAYGERGYRAMQKHHVPMQLGNQFHIMHNKFFVIDGFKVFVGTGNITTTGFERNNNNWVLIESAPLARDFQAEFEQMYAGKFATAKERIDNGTTYRVGDTTVEVYFSPQEDAMGRILEEVDNASTNIHFTIFAFTKDQVGSGFIQKHRQFMSEMSEEERNRPVISLNGEPERPKKVVGIFDRSQVHGNFLYHEIYRLLAWGVPSKMDANENSYLPGDYQAGGGRLHSKTMIIDRGTPDARVLTGSFNWSSSATIANDEVMLVLRGERITEEYYREFRGLWNKSKSTAQAICNYMKDYQETGLPRCAPDVKPGDVIISEVHWNGYNGLPDPSDHSGGRDSLTNDEFIELYNTTDEPINISLWTVTNGEDFKVGFTPGTIIQPGEYFLILDHNLDNYSETNPQRGEQAFTDPDFVLNLANDPRFPRLNLKDSHMGLRLVDSTSEVIDRAGDEGVPFAGGPTIEMGDDGPEVTLVSSMERIIEPGEGDEGVQVGDGTEAESWQTSAGGDESKINEDFKDLIDATPGAPNSDGK